MALVEYDLFGEKRDKVKTAINRLRTFEPKEGYYVADSGGKDSSVMIQLTDLVARKKGKQFDVLYIDLEAQFRGTIDHVYDMKKLEGIRDFYHIALPLALRNAVTQLQPKWICWDEKDKDKWVRSLPKDAITEENNPFDFFHKGMEFEEFIVDFARWYADKHG